MESKGGVAKFQEMSKDWENNPKILRKIIENLSEKIDELQAKAEAYDRMMSDRLTMKELANILKYPVAIENDEGENTLYFFRSTPHIGQFSDGIQFWSCNGKCKLPRRLVNFNGDWENSLTLPDGWEEK